MNSQQLLLLAALALFVTPLVAAGDANAEWRRKRDEDDAGARKKSAQIIREASDDDLEKHLGAADMFRKYEHHAHRPQRSARRSRRARKS